MRSLRGPAKSQISKVQSHFYYLLGLGPWTNSSPGPALHTKGSNRGLREFIFAKRLEEHLAYRKHSRRAFPIQESELNPKSVSCCYYFLCMMTMCLHSDVEWTISRWQKTKVLKSSWCFLQVWFYDIKSSRLQIIEYVNRNKSCNNHCTIRKREKNSEVN